MNIQLIETKDGSHSLYVPDLNENYHSSAGAITESNHIFIEHGLLQSDANPINIFEIGFGTGLNALLTRLTSKKINKKIYYTSIEKYPLDSSIYQILNYPEQLNITKQYFLQLHTCEWNKKIKLDKNFIMHKISGDWIDYIPRGKYDVVFYDAFAPDFQPNIWNNNLLMKIYNCMNPKGILTTYTVKGEIKRKLKEVGFNIEKIKGPVGGKRENLRAFKL